MPPSRSAGWHNYQLMSRDIDARRLAQLAERVGGRLRQVRAPLRADSGNGEGDGRAAALAALRNPYAIEDDPGAFHTTGWLGAYDAGHSPVAVAARRAADIAAAVDFARDNGQGLVIKGTGHDYLGRSSAPGSLLVWTHHMRDITVHDAFIPAGCGGPGVPAITVGAGTRWLEAYQAAAGQGRYVQGGGCTSVGAAGGFTQGGGFGPLAGQLLGRQLRQASRDQAGLRPGEPVPRAPRSRQRRPRPVNRGVHRARLHDPVAFSPSRGSRVKNLLDHERRSLLAEKR